jgi:RNA recognition motif-containing protein
MVPGAFLCSQEEKMATKLYVGNLSFNATTADLEALFTQVGAVASVNIITDKFSGQSRGFGFVEMESQKDAQAAIERFNGYELQGRALTVNEARPQGERSGGGRSSFGGGGRAGSGGGGRGGRRW